MTHSQPEPVIKPEHYGPDAYTDRIVAEKVMSWEYKAFPGGDDHWRNPVTGRYIPVSNWRPTADLVNAFDVIAYLRGRSPKPLYAMVRALAAQDGAWGGYAADFQFITGSMAGYATAETAPLAICLAALDTLDRADHGRP